jgi:hypothetical protein
VSGFVRPRLLQTPQAAGQSPVTLVAADGETLSGNTQSNFAGNGFYTRNGLTRAASWTGPNPLGGTFAGFDDPTFIPISVWLMDFTGTSMYTRLSDLGVNGFYPQYSSIDPLNNITYGFWSTVITEQYATPSGIPSGANASVVGVLTGEEPYDDSTYNAIVTPAAAWLAATGGSGRFHEFNFADHALDVNLWSSSITQAQAVAESNPTPRRRLSTCDMYWYAGATGGTNSATFKLPFRMYQHLSVDATQDQALRGCHYGSMIDALRIPFTAPGEPLGVWVENGAPFNETVTHEITPAELQWAIWSIFTHGGRGIQWFNGTFRSGDPNYGINNFGNDYYGGPGTAGTGIYARIKQVNRQALQIAPVLNGPTDGYRCWGTTTAVTRSGFMTSTTSTNSLAAYAGVDVSCRWNPIDSKHYVLATTRESETATSIPLTVRMVDQGQTTATPVFGGTALTVQRGGAIPGGFCEISDTFALASDYKVWRID